MSAKTKTRKAAAAALNLLPPGSRPAVTLPALPLIERATTKGTVSVTDAGLEAIALLAADGAPQAKCASALGISMSTFKGLVSNKDGDERVRLAWERGRADLEYEISSLLLSAARAGNVIAAIFYSKCQLGWSETAAPSTNVGIQIVLPDSLSRADYDKRIAARPAEIVVEAPVEVTAPEPVMPEPPLKVIEPEEDRRVDDGPPQNTHVSPLVIARANKGGLSR